MITTPMTTIREFLGFMGIHAPGHMQSLILEHGRDWTPQKLPANYGRGRMRECFRNASHLALRHKELTYVEGYACGIIPVAHAWCTDRDGNVIDNTWEDGHAYFGIPFRRDYLASRLRRYKTYGMIDQWEHRWPILTEDPATWLARETFPGGCGADAAVQTGALSTMRHET